MRAPPHPVRTLSYRAWAEGRWSPGPTSPGEGRRLHTAHTLAPRQHFYRPRTGLTQSNLSWLGDLFRDHLGTSKELHIEDFQKIIKTKNPFFAQRVFEIFDRDGNGTVSLQEFLDSMQQFAGQSHDDKIRFLFRVYDLDGDGYIQHRELLHVMRACMEENGMKFTDDQIEDLTMALFEDADVQKRGTITYEALKAQLTKHPGLLENISISIDRWLVPPAPRRQASCLKQLARQRPYQCSLPYLRNHLTYLTFLFAFIAINIGLAVYSCWKYRQYPALYILARACGGVLNFDCTFLLVMMLRNLITMARTYGMASWMPLDEHIYFHKMAGWLVFVCGLVHTFTHFCNLALDVVPPGMALSHLNSGNFTYAEWLLTMRPGEFGLIPGIANPSGIAIVVILTVMVICSQPFVRKKGNFEVFYWTHLLYVPFFALGVLHGPNFWKWLVVPGALYLFERVVRFVRVRTGHGKTYISSGIRLPSKVTHLVIKRPANMVFHPGDYIFVNIPDIAKYEWHPFTISSAPEQEDTLWLHIRALGGWTHRLYSYFEEEEVRLLRLQADLSQERRMSHRQSIYGVTAGSPPDSGLEPSPAFSSALPADTSHQNAEDDADNDVSLSQLPMKALNGAKAPAPDVSTSPNGTETRSLTPGVPFTRTHSLPNVEYRRRKEAKILTVQRSLSENEGLEACPQPDDRSLLEDILYRSPLNRTVARSFRYMRRKPTIVALLPAAGANPQTAGSPVYHAPEDSAERGAVAPEDVSLEQEADDKPACPVGRPLEIYIDGPYGTPSSHIFRAQHAVLIGTGIGVTPYASILQSIMYRYWKNRHKCPKCTYQWASELPTSVMNLRKVDFFWINRDQRSFEWFVNLLSQLEIEQAEQGGVMDRFLDMHMYITSALQKTDMKAVGLQLALDLLHEKEKRDLITGLKTRTNAGRPDWNNVFRDIRAQRKGKVTVFFCGPPALSRTLREKCGEFGFSYRKELF